MIDYIIIAWLAFSAGFAFSFTNLGSQIGYSILAKVNEVLPKKEKEE